MKRHGECQTKKKKKKKEEVVEKESLGDKEGKSKKSEKKVTLTQKKRAKERSMMEVEGRGALKEKREEIKGGQEQKQESKKTSPPRKSPAVEAVSGDRPVEPSVKNEAEIDWNILKDTLICPYCSKVSCNLVGLKYHVQNKVSYVWDGNLDVRVNM